MVNRKSLRFCAVLAVAAIALVGIGSGSSFADNGGQTPPAPTPASANELASSDGGAHGLIGKLKDGSTFSYTWRDGEQPPAAAEAAVEEAAAFCSYKVSDITYTDQFRWSTYHFCTGDYGYVTHQSRMVRSSWSGWRVYIDWRSQGPTTYPWRYYYWQMYCKGGGTYDYKATMRLYASGIGYWSPEALSNNKVRKPCGT